MNKSQKGVFIFVMLMIAAMLGTATRVAGQGAQATILGTITDSTGAAVPGANIQVKNLGTGQIVTTQSDAQGRFRVPDAPVGNYEVQASHSGFATVVHTGITLTVGSQNVVDFTLAVGQTQQTVTVEGQVTQVETTNATVGALVSQTQMRELPLNGRNFEQLIQLAPGVQNYYAGSTGANSRQGRDAAISIAGGRPEGQALLMDDQSLETFYNRGIGSITGTSLGVEAIGEFQTLTDTYGAQFGGNGAVMNAVTRSGSNTFHGSAYEFLRNSAMDARNFTDPSNVPEFRRNQYGGTVGGPIRKDKLFFFTNYEGIRFVQGFSQTAIVPANPLCPSTCRLSSTASDPKTAAAVNAVLNLLPLPQFGFSSPLANSISAQNPDGVATGQTTVVANQTAHENYLLGRIDYNYSEKDAFFGRYFIDLQDAVYPFSGGNVGLWPEQDNGANQFFNMEERHIFSPTVVNVARGSFSRTHTTGAALATHDALQMYPGIDRPDATITLGSGLTTIGTGTAAPLPSNQVQNRFTEADDIVWTKGAHSIRLGASVERVQSDVVFPMSSQSSWTFGSLPLFLAGTATTLSGITSAPSNYPDRDYREIDFTFYGQDDWKVLPRLSLNLGLRYEPMTNPIDIHNALNTIVNFRTDTGFTNVPNVLQTNPSWKNFDPRVGFAYDPFADHKTSIRGGFGIFHEVLAAGIWGVSWTAAPPWTLLTQTSPSGTAVVPFQNPSIDGGAVPFTLGAAAPPIPSIGTGYAWQINHTPYMLQYNLNVQREIMQGTVATVGYVGSHGVNLISGNQQNPVGYTIDSAGVYHFNGVRVNTSLGALPLGLNGTDSRYNSLQASLNRTFVRNVQAQASYTYSRCESSGDASLGSLSGNTPTTYANPYDRQPDYSVCGFDVRQALRLNSLVGLPFHGNRLVEGWQFSGILTASSGLPFNVSVGVDQSNQLTGVPRPNYTPNAPAQGIYPACNNTPVLGGTAMYFNPNCFSVEPFGTLGDFGREGLIGPGLVNLDFAILKSTKIRENMNLQFRAEIFNILNHTNLSYPAAALFSGTPSATATLGRVTTAGLITTYAAPSREIQLGLKLIF